MAQFPTLYPVLDELEHGRIIRTVVAVLLRIAAVFVVIGTVGAMIVLIRLSSTLEIPFVIIMVLMLLGAAIAIGQILLHRAGAISQLGDSPFTVIPIVSVLFRAAGEVYAMLVVSVGVGGALALWFTKTSPIALLPWAGAVLPDAVLSTGASFATGVVVLVSALATGFAILLVSYLAAETTVVLAEIARNTGKLVSHQGPARTPGATIAAGVRAVS